MEKVPLGNRMVYAVSVLTYLLYILDHTDFRRLFLVCNADDIIYHFKIQGLFLASMTFESLPALLIAIAVSHRRFAFLEYQLGTVGFLVWFMRTSVLFHAAFCVMMFLLSAFDNSVLKEEVHGLWPLIIINIVGSFREAENSTVWLWPLPLHVPIKAFPAILIAIAWISHSYMHLDVVAAYLLACFFPSGFLEPSKTFLDLTEQNSAAKALINGLQNFDSFVCRPPSEPSASFNDFLHSTDTGIGAATASKYQGDVQVDFLEL